MNRDHPFLRARDYGADAAGELLRSGRIALFLDGLDEMPQDMQAEALKCVDQASELRIVISSRLEEYRRAVQAFRPDNTAVIELRPVRPPAAAAYLLKGQVEPNRQRWAQVGAYLRHNPGSTASQALNNPLTLSLARDTYVGRDPTVLTETGRFPTVAAIREHLIDYVLIGAYPDEHQRAHATRRLAWIARHMATNRDLRWWDIPTWIPSWRLHVIRGLGFGLAGALGVGLALGLTHAPFGFAVTALVGVVWGGVTFGLALGLAFGIIGRLAGEPHAFAPRWPRSGELGPILAFGLAGTLGFGSVGWAVGVLALGALSFGQVGLALAGGLAFGLTVGLFSLWATPIADSPSATSAAIYRSDLRTTGIVGLGLGIGIGLVFGLAFGAAGSAVGPSIGLAYGLGLGLAGMLAAWLAFGQVPLVKLTELILIRRGWDHVHFLPLLEDACDRQVLRQAGTVYQFRHSILQDHLAAMQFVDHVDAQLRLSVLRLSRWRGRKVPSNKVEEPSP